MICSGGQCWLLEELFRDQVNTKPLKWCFEEGTEPQAAPETLEPVSEGMCDWGEMQKELQNGDNNNNNKERIHYKN